MPAHPNSVVRDITEFEQMVSANAMDGRPFHEMFPEGRLLFVVTHGNQTVFEVYKRAGLMLHKCNNGSGTCLYPMHTMGDHCNNTILSLLRRHES
jgi:hypothetical protein